MTRHQAFCHLVTIACASASLFAQTLSAAQDVGSVRTIEIFGRVLNASKQPLADAKVSLVASGDFTDNWYKDFRSNSGRQTDDV